MVLQNVKQSELTEKQLKAIELLTGQCDKPMTHKQIAAEVGVSTVTLYAWKKKPEFNAELLKQAKEVNQSLLPTVLSWMGRAMQNPKEKSSTKVKISELTLKQHGMLKDVQEASVQVDHSQEVKQLIDQYKSIKPSKKE